MITLPTHKLYFKKFLYCVKFGITRPASAGMPISKKKGTIADIKKLLTASGKEYRTRLDWDWGYSDRQKEGLGPLKIVFAVYFSDEGIYQSLMTGPYRHLIAVCSRPASAVHRDLLLSNTSIIIRSKLLFNRFRYKITFRGGWQKKNTEIITEWVTTTFVEKTPGRRGDYMLLGQWSPSLYLIDDMDCTWVKLGLSEYIYEVVRVDTFAEHGVTPEQMEQLSSQT